MSLSAKEKSTYVNVNVELGIFYTILHSALLHKMQIKWQGLRIYIELKSGARRPKPKDQRLES